MPVVDIRATKPVEASYAMYGRNKKVADSTGPSQRRRAPPWILLVESSVVAQSANLFFISHIPLETILDPEMTLS